MGLSPDIFTEMAVAGILADPSVLGWVIFTSVIGYRNGRGTSKWPDQA